jgi:hypothetical protein
MARTPGIRWRISDLLFELLAARHAASPPDARKGFALSHHFLPLSWGYAHILHFDWGAAPKYDYSPRKGKALPHIERRSRNN